MGYGPPRSGPQGRSFHFHLDYFNEVALEKSTLWEYEPIVRSSLGIIYSRLWRLRLDSQERYTYNIIVT